MVNHWTSNREASIPRATSKGCSKHTHETLAHLMLKVLQRNGPNIFHGTLVAMILDGRFLHTTSVFTCHTANGGCHYVAKR